MIFLLILAAALVAGFLLLKRKKGWRIGPVINGKNYSVGMPKRPTPEGEGWRLAIPREGHVNYVQNFGAELKGANALHVRFRIEADPGVTFHPEESPGTEGYVSLIVQRKGDDWSATGKYEHYRWWRGRIAKLEAGTFEATIPLHDGGWTSVYGKRSSDALSAFTDALAGAGSIGLSFGGDGGLGHGVFATGPATFHLERLTAERGL